MSLSTCEKCGGHIPLGPDASNRCEKCGEHVFGASISLEDHNESILALCSERDRYRKALESIKSKLSMTKVPRDKWVKELHGELFCLAHFELE